MLEVFIILMLVSMISVVLKKTTILFIAILYTIFFKREELSNSKDVLDILFVVAESLLVGFVASLLASAFIFFIIISIAIFSMAVTTGLGLLEKIVDIIKD